MVLFSSLVLLASASSTLAWSPLFERAPPGCLADNCLRAVTGTQPGQTQTATDRVADCSSFLIKTVTPETVTVTATASFSSSTTTSLTTVTTTTTTAERNVSKRSAITVSPSNVPAYASPCSGTVRYSSACSCAGITGSTITVAAPTTTTTISATSTITVDVVTTSTSVSVAPAGPPTACASPTVGYVAWGFDHLNTVEFFSGAGVTPNDADHVVAATLLDDGSLSACDAVSACAALAWDNYDADRIDVRWSLAANLWYCGAYSTFTWAYGSTYVAYNVTDITTGVAMGYQWDDDSSSFDKKARSDVKKA